MSIADVITLGFGDWGSPADVVTMGFGDFGLGEVIVIQPPAELVPFDGRVSLPRARGGDTRETDRRYFRYNEILQTLSPFSQRGIALRDWHGAMGQTLPTFSQRVRAQANPVPNSFPTTFEVEVPHASL